MAALSSFFNSSGGAGAFAMDYVKTPFRAMWSFFGGDVLQNSSGPIWNSSFLFDPSGFTQNTGTEMQNDDTLLWTGSPSFLSLIVRAFHQLGQLDGIFGYMASRWALSTVMIALILNRVKVFSTTNHHLRLNWQARVFLRIVPIAILMWQINHVTQVLHCQTSAELPEMRFQSSDSVVNRAWTTSNSSLAWIFDGLLFWQSAETSCERTGMVPPLGGDEFDFSGSLTVLWPLFLSLSLSQVAETLSCALQGREPRAETGMTIFEHSLAFAEAEAIVKAAAGMSLFSFLPTSEQASTPPMPGSESLANDTIAMSRQMIVERLNVPPEVLLISLISCFSHISSHFLNVLGLQSKFRLANTTIWGTCFLSAFVWSFVRFLRPSHEFEAQMIRYPTVCIIGFIPHLLIIFGIALSTLVFCVAVMASFISPPDRQFDSFYERLRWSHRNVQANHVLSTVKVSAKEDFFTTLLKIGYQVLGAATEAVYFNEGLNVATNPITWVEQEWIDSVTPHPKIPAELRGDFPPEGLGLSEEQTMPVLSPYARERRPDANHLTTKANSAAMREEGVGGEQRSGRWYMSWVLAWQILSLIACCWARITLRAFDMVGIDLRGTRLQKLAYVQLEPPKKAAETKRVRPRDLEFWIMSENGELALPRDSNVDVEAETRKRLRSSAAYDSSEQAISDSLYSWWRTGGWWGDLDSSGDYIPSQSVADDDDATSVVSSAMSDVSRDEAEWITDNEDGGSGARTPTQSFPHAHRRAAAFPENLSLLAQLLDPKTIEEREAAHLLSLRLQHDLELPSQSAAPMTRSVYRRMLLRNKAGILDPALVPPANRLLTPEEEATFLEHLLLTRRKGMAGASQTNSGQQAPSDANAAPTWGTTWASGAGGLGESGPQCVVCHSAPRTVLVWPCRCLSLCEECRVSLAVNNFGSCVCCRRDVVAFSRLYVP